MILAICWVFLMYKLELWRLEYMFLMLSSEIGRMYENTSMAAWGSSAKICSMFLVSAITTLSFVVCIIRRFSLYIIGKE